MSTIALIVPATSRGRNWTKLEDSYMINTLLKSLKTTIIPSKLNIYLGYDTGDKFHESFVEQIKSSFETSINYNLLSRIRK